MSSLPAKWNDQEEAFLRRVRTELAHEIEQVPCLYSDAYGDRKLLRFFRQSKNADKALILIRKYFQWRREHQVDIIRNKLNEKAYRQNPCRSWPHGDFLLNRVSIMPCSTEFFDKKGNALCVEQYGHLPADRLRDITPDLYLEWQLYCLEYKSIQLEEIAIEREEVKLKGEQQDTLSQGWGEIARLCTIFDMKGLTFGHMLLPGGFRLVQRLIPMIQNYYPWLQDTTHLVNTARPVYSFWHMLKPLLPSHTQRKIFIYNTDATSALLESIHLDSLPAVLGGQANCAELLPPGLVRKKDSFSAEATKDQTGLVESGKTTQVKTIPCQPSPTTCKEVILPKPETTQCALSDHIAAGGHLLVYKRGTRRRSLRYLSCNDGVIRLSKHQRSPLLPWRASSTFKLHPEFSIAQGQATAQVRNIAGEKIVPYNSTHYEKTPLHHLVTSTPPCCLVFSPSPASKSIVLEFNSPQEAFTVKSNLTTMILSTTSMKSANNPSALKKSATHHHAR